MPSCTLIWGCALICDEASFDAIKKREFEFKGNKAATIKISSSLFVVHPRKPDTEQIPAEFTLNQHMFWLKKGPDQLSPKRVGETKSGVGTLLFRPESD